jgi:HSP20 family protein
MEKTPQRATQKEDARETTRRNAVRPAVDIFEDADGITLFADLPGVKSDGLSIEVEGRLLAISGSPQLATPDGMRVAYAEFQAPAFYREFVLSGELDSDSIEAHLSDGVLRLQIPKREHAKPKKISVKAA